MNRRAAEVAELTAAGARAGQTLLVAHVGVDRLRRPRQAGGNGRVDDPAARPVEPRLERARLRRRSDSPSEIPATPGVLAISNAASTPAADSIRQWTGRSTFGTSSGRATLGTRSRAAQAGDREVLGVTGVDTDVDRLVPRLREQLRQSARAALRAGCDAVLEVDDHGMRPEAMAFSTRSARSAGT